VEPVESVSLRVIDVPAVMLAVQVREVPLIVPKSIKAAAETCPPGMMDKK
jgi:hypothetical protein